MVIRDRVWKKEMARVTKKVNFLIQKYGDCANHGLCGKLRNRDEIMEKRRRDFQERLGLQKKPPIPLVHPPVKGLYPRDGVGETQVVMEGEYPTMTDG